MFRVGTSTTCPEGQRWSSIKLANGYEVCQINIGVTGLVWAVLTIGKALVRTGVTRDNPMGKSIRDACIVFQLRVRNILAL